MATNSQALASLPQDAQAELKAAAAEYQQELLDAAPKRDADAIAQLQKSGVEIDKGTPGDLEEGAELMRYHWGQLRLGRRR